MKPEGMPKQELEKLAQGKVLDERLTMRRRKRRHKYVMPTCPFEFGVICPH